MIFVSELSSEFKTSVLSPGLLTDWLEVTVPLRLLMSTELLLGMDS